jgi:6,7-dimethyl-8-ribityllumazine synthase
MPDVSGALDGRGLRICVVSARWNSFVTRILCEGAVNELREQGVLANDITTTWVPGSFEVPVAAKWAAESGRFDGVICLGAVIRGETAHFDFVAGAAQAGILRVMLDTGVPIIFGVLTTDTPEQATDRAGGKEGHKGEEAARTVIEMANVRRALAG